MGQGFLEELTVTQMIKIYPALIEHKQILLFPEKLDTESCHELIKSNPYP
jgi:hypothetical protein